MDYSKNLTGPGNQKFSLEKLDQKVLHYLQNSGALADTPYKRLMEMNQPAIDLYLKRRYRFKLKNLSKFQFVPSIIMED